MTKFFKRIGCILWAFLRLINVLIIAIFSGIHNIIFNKSEIISLTLVMRPQGIEQDNLSYIDKLYANNIEFTNKKYRIPPANAFDQEDPFTPDELFEDLEDDPMDEDDSGDQGPSDGEGGEQ